MSNALKLTVPKNVPFVDSEREFDFPAAAVFRAHSDPEVFRGVFHTVRENAFVLQTFEYEDYADIVTLEYSRFEDLPGGRSKLTGRSVYPSLEARGRYLSDGMESGIAASYEQLEELLANGKGQIEEGK
jgi:uncharacterized protein YndB with AHSA1/START domain